MSVPDQEKLGVKFHAIPSLDTISTIPIKKRRYIFTRSPSPPPEAQPSLTIDCGTTQNKSFCLVQAPSFKAGDIPTSLTASSDKDSSLDSRFSFFANNHTNEALKHTDEDCNNILQSMPSIVVEGENGLKDTVSHRKLVSLLGIEQQSAPVGHVDVPMEEDISDEKTILSETYAAQRLSGNTVLQCIEAFEKAPISESGSVRQEQSELQDPCSKMKETLDVHRPNTDSTQICLDRSNWDLNTTMDAWEESLHDAAVINEGDGNCRYRGLQQNFMGDEPTKSLSRDHFLSPYTSDKSGGVVYNSETKACLDLRLNPSFMSDSCFTQENADSPKKTQFLSSSTFPTCSNAEPTSSICGVAKPEPYLVCIQLEERKTKFTGSETFGLKPIKSQPREIGDASRITVSGAANSPSDEAIKLEPVEVKSQDCVAAKETRLLHVSADDQDFLHGAKTPLEAVGTRVIASNTRIRKYEVDSMAQVMQDAVLSNDKICRRAVFAASSIPQPEKGVFCEDRELISVKQASNQGSEPLGFFIKCVAESPTLVETVADEKAEVVSYTSSSETDSKIGPVVETYVHCDVLQFNQANNESICTIEEQGDNECKTGSSHTVDGEMRAVHEKELVKHSIIESSELSKDHTTDLQESSSVTGDSNRRKTSKTTWKASEDSLKKDRDPTLRVVSIENKAEGSIENKSFVPISNSVTKMDAFDRGRRIGRIINLNSGLSQKIIPIHQRPLSDREKPTTYKSFKREKSLSGHNRYENEKRRVRGGDGRWPKQFDDRNFDSNYMHGRINDHNEMQSRTRLPSRRRSPTTSEANPSRCRNRGDPGQMMDPPLRVNPHSQFNRSDRIPTHRERRSLSPMHRERRSLSPMSRAMSPSHWSQHDTSEGFNGQPEMAQCRTETPISMQESMRSSRQHFAEEILDRRRRSAYGDRLFDGMVSREHSFQRAGRNFPRKIQRPDMNEPRQVSGEYYRTPFIRDGEIHELGRQHCIEGNDGENFSFHGEGGPPRSSYRYDDEGIQGFNEGGSSREFEGRFKNRLGNTSSRRYRHIEQQQKQQHDDGFRHEEEQGWNDSGFNNIRPKGRRY